MEVIKNIQYKISQELQTKRDREQKQKEEACKTFGEYLINFSNFCFDKCINVDSVYLTKEEENCISSMFYKFHDAHLHSINKFRKINFKSETHFLLRGDNYGDYYGFLESYLKYLNINVEKKRISNQNKKI
jgi:hypothetical protein